MPSAPTVLEHPYGTIEDGEAFLKRISWFLEPPLSSKFGALWLDQLDDPGPEHAWLVRDWLSIGDRSVLAGDSRGGKSFIGLEIAFSIVFGIPLFGQETKQGGVIYQTGEGARGFRKRLRAIRAHRNFEFGRTTPFVWLQKAIDIYKNDEMLSDLIAEINAHAKIFEVPLRLVVIDTLATATVGADEISGKDMGLVLENVRLIAEKCNCAVMLVHHLSAGGRVRGHTSVYAHVDQVMLLTRDEETEIRTLKLDKQKDGEEGLELKFELLEVVLGQDETGKNVTSCVCQALNAREVAKREEQLKGEKLSPPTEVLMKAFFEAERRYGMVPPRGWELPPRVAGIVLWDDVKRIYSELSPSDALTPDQQTNEEAAASHKKRYEMLRQRTMRARDHLVAHDILALGVADNQPVCWWTGKPLRAFKHTQPERRDGPELDTPF